jgi:hypothetical protein
MATLLRSIPISDIALCGSRFSCEMGLFGAFRFFFYSSPDQIEILTTITVIKLGAL